MKILFYSTKDYEQPYLESANLYREEIVLIKEALDLQSADKASGYDAVCIFTADDASAPVLEALVGSSRVDLQACKLEYSIVSPK